MKVLETSRLQMELMTKDDAQLLFELDQDPEVMRYINGGKMTSMEDIHQRFIPRLESFTDIEKGWGLWKVIITESNTFIGWVLVRPMDYFTDNPQWRNLELGWRFMQKSWGKGYATEAAQHIMNALLNETAIDSVCAIAVEDNLGSINIMKKLGMEYVKTYLHEDPLGDMDVVYYLKKK
ncbi:GNAT family N-acetyltransferase [Thalassotalea atypica]|uniref:GNAT family N-acetyltransferase n=1 Tax=Thalassotalea atypica TaxID=2054316 RepID=UPI0025738CDE|nr:GNAT family N-acetyltransferase [Thalassotalea atypica]